MSSAVKFGRGYSLQIDNPKFVTPFVVTLPTTIEFDIERTSYPSNNFAKIKLYNLSAQHRLILTHDFWDPSFSLNATFNITLSAGYGPGPHWPVVFQGNTWRANSYREGVNFITELQSFDGGRAYANGTSRRSFSANQPIQQVYDELISDLLPFGISRGVVSKFIGKLGKGMAVSGNTIDILRDLTNSNFFVDNLKMNILHQADAIGGHEVLINAASGLLGTPVKEEHWLSFSILFEPRLVIGSAINLQSISSLPIYNGLHKVLSVHHKAMISDSVAGEAVTTLQVESGPFENILQQTSSRV